jgi:hypothetical protein
VGALDDYGNVRQFDEPVLVRMHRRDLLGDIFEEATNPTGKQLRTSMQLIHQAGRGALIYLRPEGYGEDLRAQLQRIRRPRFDDVNTPDLTRPEGVGGRAQPLVSYLIERGHLTPQDLEEASRLLGARAEPEVLDAS